MRALRARGLLVAAAVLLLPVGASRPPSRALDDVGSCYFARMHEAFALPDGSSHVPGMLRVCVVREWSPSQTLYSIFVDGQAVGGFLGRRECRARMALDARPVFQFVRSADGVLRFTGYALMDPGGLLVQSVTTKPKGTAPVGALVAVSAHGSR
jgi:hypothetical protein